MESGQKPRLKGLCTNVPIKAVKTYYLALIVALRFSDMTCISLDKMNPAVSICKFNQRHTSQQIRSRAIYILWLPS